MTELIIRRGHFIRNAARWVADNVGGTEQANIKLWQRYGNGGRHRAIDRPVSRRK